MTLHDFLLFSTAAVVVAVVTHWFVQRFWWAVLVSALVSSLVNIAHELVAHDFAVRPSDAVLWLPMLLVEGMIVALPVVAVIGVPFYVVRRRRHSNAA
jgi:hypothetical protein